jgi:peroxiredoxin
MAETGIAIGQYAPDFELPGTDGTVHHLTRYRETHQAVAVIVMGNACPYVHRYLDRIKQLQADFALQGATLIGINANSDKICPEESFQHMKAFEVKHQLNFPYLRDMTQEVARSFGAKRTPEAFLVDKSGILRYVGAIDDHPQTPKAVKTAYLREAMAQLLAGETIRIGLTQAIGGLIQ